MTSYIRCRECLHAIIDCDDWLNDDVHGLIICRHCGATVCSEDEFGLFRRAIE